MKTVWKQCSNCVLTSDLYNLSIVSLSLETIVFLIIPKVELAFFDAPSIYTNTIINTSIRHGVTGQNGRGQNGTDKMVATFIDSNSTELNFYSITTSHK